VKKRLRHLPACFLATAGLLVVGLPAGFVWGRAPGLFGVLGGAALVVVSYLISSLVVAWVDMHDRALLLPVVLLTYVLKFTVFGVVMWSISTTGWAGLPAMGVAVIAATVVWTSAQGWWILRAKIPYVEIE
jgi:ATP synthase protein I